ncbi:MAG: AAA family ATPase [Aliidongia sp.]
MAPRRGRAGPPLGSKVCRGRRPGCTAVWRIYRQSAYCLAESGLVTIIGAGGVGKTRLAIEIAHGAVPEYRDGVVFVDLAVLGEAGLVPTAVATALGISLGSNEATVDLITRQLKSRSVLMVLDNCEHLVDAAAELAQTLSVALPNLRVLATSREALSCAGEQVYYLAPLVPPTVVAGSVDAALQNAAIALLVDRVHAADSRFALTEGGAASRQPVTSAAGSTDCRSPSRWRAPGRRPSGWAGWQPGLTRRSSRRSVPAGPRRPAINRWKQRWIGATAC